MKHILLFTLIIISTTTFAKKNYGLCTRMDVDLSSSILNKFEHHFSTGLISKYELIVVRNSHLDILKCARAIPLTNYCQQKRINLNEMSRIVSNGRNATESSTFMKEIINYNQSCN